LGPFSRIHYGIASRRLRPQALLVMSVPWPVQDML
jgi:hypothetical protein